MRQRTQRRKRKRAENAVVRGDEPPDPIITPLIAAGAFLGSHGAAIATGATIASGLAGTAVGVKGLIGGGKGGTAAPKLGATKSPLAGQPTGLTPGQKVNAINTTPQGLLEPASTARNTLLGN